MASIEDELSKAKSYKDSGKIDDAKEVLRCLLERAADDWRIWNELGHVHVRADEYTHAKESFEKAIKLEPKHSGLWNNLGFTLKIMGDLSGAIEATNRSMEFAKDPSDVMKADYNLACYLSLSGDTEEALNHLRRACETNEAIREWAKEDSDLNAIRNEPRFREIIG